ncbi:poly-beta-1,6-N-acetyl-D-glucosamine synthase [Solimonas marina]|uniref:Poly-beta-1,6-N-acetyl-D-glucosamine synthase n=1 Tax=Solimonas marina TaxID=2714601 RepID=A0A969WBU0_9GAMM|nr:poly-beta-1,6-N-acetyl-D-glucosamine synthase [Solimonas marina]NKF22576.1 poly-beta-1,6 N-acetyl-D-glucosamine synthase [Solimonas marina]
MNLAFGHLGLLRDFIFFYPLLMAFIWMVGGVYYYWRRERGRPDWTEPPPLRVFPPVSILVPCHNEGETVEETMAALALQQYPDFEVIAINDGSRDDTGARLDAMLSDYPWLRVIHLHRNAGKAAALKVGAMASSHEFFVCIDGDALLEPHAVQWMMSHFVDGVRVGAVTGNPRIRNRSTLIGKLQVGEFSSIIGLIKRGQRSYGRLFTVSGVISAFRRTALHRVGYWADNMMTEDIDISWRLQRDHWDIRYEPNALCYILMPETLRGLWRQRLRWAQGGIEVLIKEVRRLLFWRERRMWGVLLEFLLSVTWSYAMLLLIVLWGLSHVIDVPAEFRSDPLLPRWNGVVLGMVCLTQFAVSHWIDRRYEPKVWRGYYWMIWYPIAYWLLNMLTVVAGVPKALLRRGRGRAVWVSPDRGLR